MNQESETYRQDLYIVIVVYYESRKGELKIRLMNEGRCDERRKARVEESTSLTYTGFHDKTILFLIMNRESESLFILRV